MLAFLLILWLIVAVTAAIVAANKNRSAAGWFLLCLLLTPLAILPLVALKPRPASGPPPDDGADLTA